jgi:hypothetical protein
MILTNKFDLPDTIYEAVVNDPYEQDGDISATGMIKSPRMRQLELRHDKDLSEDCSDRLFMLQGRAIHYVLQVQSPDNVLVEERLSCEIAGWVVTGQADLLDNKGVLSDYKWTSVWSVVYGLKPEWEAQDNIYGYLYRFANFSVKKLQIVVLLRDWSQSRARQGGDYPPCACVVMPVPLWSDEKCFQYIEDRVIMHQAAEKMADNDLPPCTPEERWEKPTTYAVIKKGRKSALRVLPSWDEAEKWIKDNGKGDLIETRWGESTRCEGYCVVKDVCNQYKETTWNKANQ